MEDMKYVAIDIGSTKCKIVKGKHFEGNISTELVSRFRMSPVWKNGQFVWSVGQIFENIVEGLGKALEADYIAIDSFPSDFVLLDAAGNPLGPVVAFKDQRGDRAVNLPDGREVFFSTAHIPYPGDTISQLRTLAEEEPELLGHAETFMFLPDYFNYLLTGVKTVERTMASASNLLSALTGDWDYDILREIGVPMRIFPSISDPGTVLGPVKDEIAKEIGYSAQVVLASSYDKASSFFSAPRNEDTCVILSGIGTVLATSSSRPIVTEEAFDGGFSSGVSACGEYAVYKRLYGLSMIDRLKNEAPDGTTYDMIMEEARSSECYSIVDLGKLSIDKTRSMVDVLNDVLEEHEKISERRDAAAILYRSFAAGVKKELDELEKLLGRTFSRIVITGGGGSDSYLDDLVAMMTGKEVVIASEDASAIGNIALMMLSSKELEAGDVGTILENSFTRRRYRRISAL